MDIEDLRTSGRGASNVADVEDITDDDDEPMEDSGNDAGVWKFVIP